MVPQPSANGTQPITPTQALWRALLVQTASDAYQKLPENASRIDMAVRLILADAVTLVDAHTAEVTSLDSGAVYMVDSACSCKDFAEAAPHKFCKHRLARALFLRTMEAAKAYQVPALPEVQPDATPTEVPAQYLIPMHGKTFILYNGLRYLAEQRGLRDIQVTPISVTSELAVFQATAHFDCGRTWSEIGDATPSNVGKKVAHAFIRMAATRAKARCLREALRIDLVAFEELEGDAE
jgi:hypothetical protein